MKSSCDRTVTVNVNYNTCEERSGWETPEGSSTADTTEGSSKRDTPEGSSTAEVENWESSVTSCARETPVLVPKVDGSSSCSRLVSECPEERMELSSSADARFL